MDSSTSTASLLLFPSTNYESDQSQYQHLQLMATLPLPAPVPPPKPAKFGGSSRQQTSIKPRGRPTMYSSESESEEYDLDKEERRLRRREEKQRRELTSYRSEDGLLSPPPVGSRRRRSGSTPPMSRRGIPVPPSNPSHGLSVPSTPPPFSPDLSLVGLRLHAYDDHLSNPPSPQRPKPFKARTMDETLLIKPPLPSLLRPKSFWKNHPRSALTAPSYSPSTFLVRRSTFVAAGLDIDELDHTPDGTSNVGGFGNSLWNASTLAFAVESRTEQVVFVPGSGVY